jgi:hypothetical protein
MILCVVNGIGCRLSSTHTLLALKEMEGCGRLLTRRFDSNTILRNEVLAGVDQVYWN